MTPAVGAPPVPAVDLVGGLCLGLGMTGALWLTDHRPGSVVVLVLTVLAAAAVSQRPLEEVRIGEDWIANRIASRVILLEVSCVRSIEMPTHDTGAYLVVRGPHQNVLVDIESLFRDRALGGALLPFVDRAVAAGTRIDPDARDVLDALRRATVAARAQPPGSGGARYGGVDENLAQGGLRRAGHDHHRRDRRP